VPVVRKVSCRHSASSCRVGLVAAGGAVTATEAPPRSRIARGGFAPGRRSSVFGQRRIRQRFGILHAKFEGDITRPLRSLSFHPDPRVLRPVAHKTVKDGCCPVLYRGAPSRGTMKMLGFIARPPPKPKQNSPKTPQAIRDNLLEPISKIRNSIAILDLGGSRIRCCFQFCDHLGAGLRLTDTCDTLAPGDCMRKT
jgi:hypothetical protein